LAGEEERILIRSQEGVGRLQKRTKQGAAFQVGGTSFAAIFVRRKGPETCPAQEKDVSRKTSSEKPAAAENREPKVWYKGGHKTRFKTGKRGAQS